MESDALLRDFGVLTPQFHEEDADLRDVLN
jgi:hypothetical protein